MREEGNHYLQSLGKPLPVVTEPPQVDDAVEQDRDAPADRIGHVQHAERVVGAEIGVDPGDAEAAHADERRQCRQEREADAAQRADDHVHDTARKIAHTDDTHADAAVGNRVRIFCVDADEL